MNIKDSYIHNGTAVLKDIKVENSVLKKILAGKDANDAYLDWVDVATFGSHAFDSTSYLPTVGGTMTGKINISYNASNILDDTKGLNFGQIAHIGISDNFGIYTTGQIILRPNQTWGSANSNGLVITSTAITYNGNSLLHAGNYTSYVYSKSQSDARYVLKVGDTMTGALTVPSLTVSGASSFSQAINGSILGNAATASRWQNGRKLTLSGKITGNVTFDGSADFALTTATNFDYVSALGKSGSTITWSKNGTAQTALDFSTTFAPYNADGYLPLSGGTISSSEKTPLIINSTSATEVGIRFTRNGTAKGWVGYVDSDAAVKLWNSSRGKALCYKDNGTLEFERNLVAHAGNISQSATPVSVTWNTETTIATIAGKDLKIKIPDNPNVDEKVKQSASTTDKWRKVLLSTQLDTTYGTAVTEQTGQAYVTNVLEYQPSTGTLKATTFDGNVTGTASGLSTTHYWANVAVSTTQGSTTTPTAQPVFNITKVYAATAGLLELHRSDTNGGAFVQYYAKNQSNYWQIGSNIDSNVTFYYSANSTTHMTLTNGGALSNTASITAGTYLKSTTYTEATTYVTAGSYVKATTYLEAGSYVRAKGNDVYIGSASGSQCHLQYNNTNKCLMFKFD